MAKKKSDAPSRPADENPDWTGEDFKRARPAPELKLLRRFPVGLLPPPHGWSGATVPDSRDWRATSAVRTASLACSGVPTVGARPLRTQSTK
jgi:hypothetical protein